jgi:hypothetical protein
MTLSRRVQLALLTCAALAIRLVELGRQALWADELQRVIWAKGYDFDRDFAVQAFEIGVRAPTLSVGRALDVISRHNPPLNGALLNLWLRITGDADDAMARLPSAVFSAASVPVTYFALQKRFGHGAAICASALVALSPFHVYHAQEVNHYPLAFLLIALTFWFFLRYEEAPHVRDGVGWSVAAALGFYAHYYAAIVVAFQWLSLAVTARRPRPGIRYLVGPPLLMIGLLLPYGPRLRGQLTEMTSEAQIGAYLGLDYFQDRTRANLVMPYLGEAGNGLAPLLSLPVIAFSIVLVGLGLYRLHRNDRWLWGINTVGPIVFVTLAFFLRKTNSILWPRYQLFFSFSLFASVGVAIASMKRHAVWPAAAVLALFGVGLDNQRRIVREDWRTVARHIDREAANEPIFVYRQNLVYGVARYLHGNNRLFGVGPTPHLESTLAGVLATESTSTGVWYASAWPEGEEMDRRMFAFLSHRYDRCDRKDVNPGVVSMKLTRCVGVHPPDARDTPAFWRARPGPLAEYGWVESVTTTKVSGWAFSSGGLKAMRLIVDGRTVAEAPHPGASRPDVSQVFSALPRDLTEPSGFYMAVELNEDVARRARVYGVHEDGSLFEPRDDRPR